MSPLTPRQLFFEILSPSSPYYVLFESNFSSHQMTNEISPTSSNNNFATSFSAALAFWRGSTISWMTYLRMLRERKLSLSWKSDNHYHYLIILSEDSSPGGLSLHLRQSRAHHRSQPWQDVHCPSVVHFPKQLNKLFIGWIMATCSTVYGVSQKSVLIEQHHKVDRCLARNSPRPTTINRPTYWAPNEPARPICAQESIFLGLIAVFGPNC